MDMIYLKKSVKRWFFLLTYLPLVPHICVSKSGQHWFSYWRVACSVPRHYLNQCWNIVNLTPRYKLQWNLKRNSCIFIQENAFENVVCEMASTFSRPYLPLVPHICVSKSGQHWFSYWRVACSAPSHYLNQCWHIVNWTHWNKFQWNLNHNSIIFIQENAFEIVVCQNGGLLVQGEMS